MTVPRVRVIIDNDFSGDPDDLYQLVHHALSPSVEIPFIIASHLGVDDFLDSSSQQADNAARIATETLQLMGLEASIPVLTGSNFGLTDPSTPIDNDAVQAIIKEALRTDTDLPLYIALGAGLTELASALLIEPRIAEHLTAVWIGGSEHPGLAEPLVGAGPVEYNLAIDLIAGQVVFNTTNVQIWQVPRDVYRQCLVSRSELESRVRPHGALGEYLVSSIDTVIDRAAAHGRNLGETYALGDSPLVLLTALQSAFEPDSSSSSFVIRPTPTLDDLGGYVENLSGRPLRIYTKVDTRLMFEDFFLKLAAFAS